MAAPNVYTDIHSLLLVPLVCGLIFVRLVGATSSDGFLFLIFVCLMQYTALNRLQSFVHIFAFMNDGSVIIQQQLGLIAAVSF